MTTGLIGKAALGQAQLGAGDAVSGTPSFMLSPAAAHAIGVVSVTATFANATASASNSFAIASGPASGIANYVKVNATTATFDLTISAVSSTPVVITDSVTGTSQSFSAAAIAPGAPTGVVATAGNAQASVAFAAPADNGGDAITGYTVAASSGQTASGASSPIVVTGLSNGVAVTFVVTATTTAGTSPASSSSSAVTPTGPISAGVIQQIAPFLSTDTLVAPGFEVYSGAGSLIAALVTAGLASIANEANGILGAISVTLDGWGGFNGYALWQTGQAANVYAPRELYLPPCRNSGASTGKVTKVVVFPYGTPMTAPGYQLFANVAGTCTAIGSRVTAGIAAIPHIATGLSVDLAPTLAADRSFRGIIVWDNGAGVYAPADEVVIPPFYVKTPATKTITVSVTDPVAAPYPDATGLEWAWFDEALPHNFTHPADFGSNAAVSGGSCTLTVSTTLASGASGTLILAKADGTVSGMHTVLVP